jgi:hydroxyacylglutathione hydrolase
MLFTGDIVFVGDVGRPDLLENAAGLIGTKEIGAHQMFESLKIFANLPDFVQVWPAHGAGSACGKALGAVPSTTVGYEKVRNWALQYDNNEKGFVEELLNGQPEPPKYFAMMKKLNKINRPLLTSVPQYKELAANEFVSHYNTDVTIIDTRHKLAFAAGFIPNSINIQNNKAFSNWAGWVLDYNNPFILIVAKDQLEDVTRKLMRIGLDQAIGFITPESITTLGISLVKQEIIQFEEMNNALDNPNAQILDVRNESEFKAAHLPNATNLFVGTLIENLHKIDPNKELYLHCQSGDRATIATSLLYRAGIKKIKNYSGSMKDWKDNKGKTIQ